MTVTHKLNMNLDKLADLPRINVVQGDAYTRELQLNLYTEGKPWEIPTGAKVLIRFRKPDGTGGSYDTLPDGVAAAAVNGNTATVTLAPQVLTAVGAVLLTVTLVQGAQELSTFSLVVTVHRNTTAAVDASGNYVSVEGLVPAPESAAQGQYLEVESVDENGKITRMRAVDLSAVTGKDGRGISSIERTDGNGAPGTTDTYTITLTDGSTSTFTVYNGKDGTGGSGVTMSQVNEAIDEKIGAAIGGSY